MRFPMTSGHLLNASMKGLPKMSAPKHRKSRKPTDSDLRNNPLIGGSKGTTMAGVTSDELEEEQGVNTIEGDIENDTNAQGGVDKAVARNTGGRPHK